MTIKNIDEFKKLSDDVMQAAAAFEKALENLHAWEPVIDPDFVPKNTQDPGETNHNSNQ